MGLLRKIDMITLDRLRERLMATNSWKEIDEALGLNISPEVLAREVLTKPENDWIIWKAFVDGSIQSKNLRDKLHKHPFPDIAHLGVYSDISLEHHIGGGLANAMEITSRAERHHHSFETATAVLDFGCGTSRILRYMIEFCPGPRYFASEVVSENIKWGQRAFPEVTYLRQGNYPPVEMEDGSFEIIYAYSIFTHFEETLHFSWLSELYRLLQPGGLLILTVHGEKILRRCKEEEDVRKAMCMEGRDYEKVLHQYNEGGYVFYDCYEHKHLAQGGIDAALYGIAYISPEYIKRNWSNHFQILDHDEGAVSNWQDYVVLKRR